MEDDGPKISTIEAFILVCYVGLLDAIGVALLVFALDDFFILDLLSFPVTQIYLRMKKVSSAGIDVAAGIAELIPWVGGLPLKTIGIALVIFADRHPESWAAKATEKAGTVTAVAKGNISKAGTINKGA